MRAPMLPMTGLARRWRRDDRGVSAIEFALALPFLMVLYFGGYQTTQAVSAYRKTTILTRTVADLATQYTSLSASDVSTVFSASSQVMAPFSTTGLKIVLTEFQVSLLGIATVTWSQAYNATPLTVGQIVVLPANVCQPGASVVLSNVSYSYTPAVGYKVTGPVIMSDHLYMSPRQVASIPFTG